MIAPVVVDVDAVNIKLELLIDVDEIALLVLPISIYALTADELDLFSNRQFLVIFNLPAPNTDI